MIRRSSFFRTGLTLIAVPVLVEIGAVLLLLRADANAADADAWSIHSKTVLARAVAAATLLADAHSAARGVALFRDPSFERRDRESLNRWPAQIAELRALTADNPPQQAQLDRVAASGRDYLTWFNDVGRLAEAGRWEAYSAELLSYRGKQMLDVVESDLEQFITEEERLDEARIAERVHARVVQRRVVVAVLIVSLGGAIVVVVAFARGVSARVGHVAANARRLASSEPLAERLPGSDEIASLDRVLHESAKRLREAADSDRRYAAELARQRDELELANRQLAFKTQENEMFVYSVSHDLRSPLVNLQGFTQELSHGCTALTDTVARLPLTDNHRGAIQRVVDADMRTAITFIQNAVTRLAAIVDALLRLSRAGSVRYDWHQLDLHTVVDRVVRSLRITIDERLAQVEIGPLPGAAGDRTAVEQIFQNLIANALHYLDPQRPGRIAIGCREPQPGDPADRVTIYVRDNGRGIAAAHQRKLFVPFERLHGDGVKGEGVGLALVKRIVERHGGRIWVESIENTGTTFYVQLPAADAPPPPTTHPLRAEQAQV